MRNISIHVLCEVPACGNASRATGNTVNECVSILLEEHWTGLNMASQAVHCPDHNPWPGILEPVTVETVNKYGPDYQEVL
jgi:hypothetical protein